MSEALLTLATTLATRAADAIMRVRAGGFVVDAKRDDSPVTEADRLAEALITAGLRAATPDIPVVAEEEVAAGAGAEGMLTGWLVDPLDGTREFALGTADFTVNIGLVRAGMAVLGAVALPAYGEVFGGIVGVGAWKQAGGGARVQIAVRAAPTEGLTVMASRHYADDPALAAHLATLKVARTVNIGSAVKFCRLAEGVADYYPRLGRTMEWDTAAPQAVLEAAGGSVRLMDGGALRYGKPGWLNPPFICRGR
jgi:3'(2'), 5'-bisphosphate nucleotidase